MVDDNKSNFDEVLPRDGNESSIEDNNSKAFDQISSDLQYEKDRRKEERFLFVSIITVLVNGYLFAKMSGWAGQVVIGVIELFGLMVYARHCGVEEVDRLIDKALKFSPLHNGKKDQATRDQQGDK